MDLSIVFIVIGVLVVGFGVYTKFLKKQDGEQGQQQVKEQAPKKKTITYGKVKLYYASQSGTASKYCGILEDEAKESDFQPQIVGLENFQEHLTENQPQLAIFLIATHGEGDPTDNAVEFMKWLKDAPRDCFNNMQFSVFALGNSQYEHYCKQGKDVDAKLEKLGAKRVYALGQGDDNCSLEDDFNDWKENIWKSLQEIIPSKPLDEQEEQSQNQEVKKEEQQQFQKNLTAQNLDFVKPIPGQNYEFQTAKFLNSTIAYVKSIKEIRQNNKDGSTLHMEIDLSKSQFKYKTAQNLEIFVENDPKLVQDLANYLSVDLDQVITNPQGAKKVMFPEPLSVRDVFTYFVDFQGQLMKKTLKELANLSTSEEAKERLQFLATAKGKQDFEKEILQAKATLFQLLVKYSIKPTLQQFLLLNQRLAPRLFTISSSSSLHPQVVHVTDSILVDDLPDGGKKVGVCSQFFQNIYEKSKTSQNIKIRVGFQESHFVLPQDQSPVIMIGAGTGIAPFIAFAQEKQFLMQKGINICPGEFTLFFGCRHENGDYIFKDEIQQFQQDNVINKVYTAFSRDQGHKIYVQDRVVENGQEIYDKLFNQNATIFMCGSNSMGNSVVKALGKVVSQCKSVSEEEGLQIVKDLEANKKLIKELW